jgi:tRNA dimethylallyltransferase
MLLLCHIHLQRGKTPIVVGGTGFYLRWFIYGKAATPPSNPEAAAKARALVEQAWDAAAAAAAAAAKDAQQAAAVAGDMQAGQQVKGASCDAQQQQQQQEQHHCNNHSSTQELQQQQLNVQQEQQQQCHQLCDVQLPAALQQQSLQDEARAAGVQGDSLPANTAAAAAAAAAGASGLSPAQPTPSAAAAAALTDDQRWDLAVDVVRQLGDAATAGRIRAERNNWYRLQRVLQILLQNGGKPLSEMDIDTTKPLDYDFRWAGLSSRT